MHSMYSFFANMMFIVPDELLEAINCDFCHKFLSVGPVKVYPNKKTKCGRCSEVEDSGVVSQYGLVVRQGLFKCVNRFDGCKKLLRYDQVANHEDICQSETHVCPVCPETTEIPTFLLTRHFLKEHVGYFLKIPSFELDLTTESTRRYLYRVKENLFYIESRASMDKINLNSFIFGDPVDDFGVKQKFTLWYENGSKKIQTESQSCTYIGYNNFEGFQLNKPEVDVLRVVFDLSLSETVDLVCISENCSLESKLRVALSRKIILGSGFQRDHPNISVNSNSTSLVIKHNEAILTVIPYCHNCSLPLSLSSIPSYLEVKPRIYQPICHYCGFFYSKKSPEMKFTSPKELRYKYSPNNHITYSCIWGCTETFPPEKIFQHESECLNQEQQTCPVPSCYYRCRLFNLEEHFKVFHPQDRISLIPKFPINKNSLPVKWYVWVQFTFLSIKLSTRRKLVTSSVRIARETWTIAISIDPRSERDMSLEPKCMAYAEGTGMIEISRLSSAEHFDFVPTRDSFDILCYFEVRHPSTRDVHSMQELFRDSLW